MGRGLWFLAGAGAGVYVVVKARRVAEAFTPDGLRDRLSGAAVGAQLFLDEVRTGMTDREIELRERFATVLDGPAALPSSSRPNRSALEPPATPLAAEPPSVEGTN